MNWINKCAALAALGSLAWSITAQTVDLVEGNSGRIGPVLFEFTDTQPTGTGYIDPFVRIQKKGVEQGYNTSGRPLAFDEKNPLNYTHDLQVKDLGGGTNINGVVYYQFLLDINEPGNEKALLSLDDIQLYVSPTGEKTTSNLSELGRLIFSTGEDWILLDYARNSGSGSGDMYMFVPKSLFAGAGPDDFVYLYSKFGTHFGSEVDDSEAGFEEWAVIVHPPSPCPEITATGGTIDCLRATVQLRASSDTAGSTFSWSGPNGFTSSSQNPTVSVPGTYTVTVSNGNCSATAVAVVADARQDFTVSAQGGSLTCDQTSVRLQASSTLAGVTFTWSGPGIVSGGTTATPTVNQPGVYTVVAKDATSGCESRATATVVNSSVDVAVTATGGVLDCEQTSVQLRASSTTPGATFAWTGPAGFASTAQNPVVTLAGSYTVTATAGTCRDSATVVVTDERRVVEVRAQGAAITCDRPTVQLQVTSVNVSDVTFTWSGPGIVSGGNTASPTVNLPGTYTVIARDPISGCEGRTTVLVTEQQTNFTLQATGGALDCFTPTVVLNATASVPGATFQWSGPGIVSGANTANVTVNQAGTYTVTATVAGCSSTTTAAVSGQVGGATEASLNLPTGVVNFKVHSAPHATFEFELLNAPAGFSVSNGKFTAWCIEQDDAIPTGETWAGTMHSTRNAPVGWQNYDWRKVNYILNHKRTATADDVQKAIWSYVGRSTTTPLQLTATAQALVTEAEENADCYPASSDDVTGVIVSPSDDSLQMLLVEVPIQSTSPIVTAQITSSGDLALSVSAPVDSAVVLESSTDLKTWSSVETITGHNGRVNRSIKPNHAEKGRFFRTRIAR